MAHTPRPCKYKPCAGEVRACSSCGLNADWEYYYCSSQCVKMDKAPAFQAFLAKHNLTVSSFSELVEDMETEDWDKLHYMWKSTDGK